MEQTLTIKLFEPGMTELHRVGLAGLYMTLKAIENQGRSLGKLRWKLKERTVDLFWTGEAERAFQKLFNTSFGLTKNGLISFAVHQELVMGRHEQLLLHEAILNTFLQLGKTRKTEKKTKKIIFDFENKQVVKEFKPVLWYPHQDAHELFIKKSRLTELTEITGWLYPGGIQRHVCFPETKLDSTPARLICLLYAPVASLYYRLQHKGPDGKYDARRNTALVLPHVKNLTQYAKSYSHYLKTRAEQLLADGMGDAGLMAMLALKAKSSLDDLGVCGCTVVTMGTVGWSTQQKTRTAILRLDQISEEKLKLYSGMYHHLPNRKVIRVEKGKGGKKHISFFIASSLTRGAAAENISLGREWYQDFNQLMKTKEAARMVGFEKGGLNNVVSDKDIWKNDSDSKFVEAVHAAIRNRYGMLAGQAKQRGTVIRFDREFERMRTGLMRCKNLQTCRAELADLFVRGGINRPLQENWQALLPVVSGADWQRARDLALLALASYKGQGAETEENKHENGREA